MQTNLNVIDVVSLQVFLIQTVLLTTLNQGADSENN